MGLGSPNDVTTLMGWNQAVFITPNGESEQILRVTDYEIGTKQTPDAPDYVTGRQDRTAWTRGPVEIDGTLNYPLTFENNGQTFNGFRMFLLGSELARDITKTFSIRSSAGEVIGGCKVATTSISCNSGEPIQCSSTVWGISEDTGNISVGASDSRDDTPEPGIGAPIGENVDGKFTTVQIPMWDACQVSGAPSGMLIVGFNIQIDNQLKRNYTMGNDTVSSPWGLNATSISAGQRKITGSVTWQSDDAGKIKQILGAGIQELTITIRTGGTPQVFNMTKCLWNAQPPKLSTGDRVTIETGFTALGIGQDDFDALKIEPGA